jgi:hypothetical protein
MYWPTEQMVTDFHTTLLQEKFLEFQNKILGVDVMEYKLL